ncbi:MAG: cysteine desulfurase [candidate division Zixibacteria bacterium]|nr:cysteine desulfurase [candidate division Zixibacteria bacterium]
MADNSSKLCARTIKADFPVLSQDINGHKLVYLDNAASSQKPQTVIDELSRFYSEDNANIHRGLHTLAERSTNAYESTRKRVAKFIGCQNPEEVILNSGTTAAINLIAYSWGEEHINEGDEIVITEMEHHANLIPWVILAKRKKAVLKRIPITSDGRLNLDSIEKIITDKTKIVALSHMSNVLGTINPVSEIAEIAHKHGAVVVADGAQAVPHMPVNVTELGVDFYTFSAHKMLGPTGVGVLWGKKELLEKMQPFMTGGEMIREVHFDKVTWANIPHRFEPGTPNIAGVIGFAAAIDYLEKIGMDKIRQHEIEITQYALEKLSKINKLEIQGPTDPQIRGAAISFTDSDIHPHDISTFLDSKGIAIRAGHHCAQPLLRILGKVATARASFYIYNDEADVDRLVEAIIEMKKYFGV